MVKEKAWRAKKEKKVIKKRNLKIIHPISKRSPKYADHPPPMLIIPPNADHPPPMLIIPPNADHPPQC